VKKIGILTFHRAINYGAVLQAYALLENCERVRWSHVRRMTKPVLRHRLRLTAQANRDGQDEDSFVETLLDRLESRHKNLARGLD